MPNYSMAAYLDTVTQSKKIYARMMEPVCQKWSLTKNEVDVLLFLHNNPQFDRAADIVTRRAIAKSHVSLSVGTLEAKGLLRREFSEADRRTAHLKLTDYGREVAREARKVQTAFFNTLYRGITDEEMLLWRKITQKVSANIENFESIKEK